MKNIKTLPRTRTLRRTALLLTTADPTASRHIQNSQAGYSLCGTLTALHVSPSRRTLTAHPTYADPRSAALALICFHHLALSVRCQFAIVQYCKYFLRGSQCRNEYCPFLHSRDQKNQITVETQNTTIQEQHYQMAIEMMREDGFKLFRQVFQAVKCAELDTLVRQGLIRAQEVLLRVDAMKGSIVERDGDTVDLLGESTEESSAEHIEEREGCFGLIQESASAKMRDKQTDSFSLSDYINIRLIKRLLREDSSKLHCIESSEQIAQRGKMILYQIVRK